jgi:tetratricopeptide (TPR) repeat protein
MTRRIIFVVAFLAIGAASASAQAPAWLTHYQRGERQLSQGQHQEAALSFLKAIRIKDRDNERERLSGTRVIAYFPRRELGIALMHLGIADFAEEELRISLSQNPSDRARNALQSLQQRRERP